MDFDIVKENKYWKKYYKLNPNPYPPSSFSKFVRKYLNSTRSLIDLGCGNGRDAIYFAQMGLNVCGVDLVKEEINHLNSNFSSENLQFICADFTNYKNIKFDYIYSRFTMHSITDEQESNLISWVKRNMSRDGYFFLEARSINDSKYKEGEKISDHENFADNHYRRYMNLDYFKKILIDNKLKIVYEIESAGLAIAKQEDPVIIRLVIQHQ